MTNPFEEDAMVETAVAEAQVTGLSARVVRTDTNVGHTDYIMTVVSDDGDWEVQTRYSEVEKLVNNLQKQSIILPPLPRKRSILTAV